LPKAEFVGFLILAKFSVKTYLVYSRKEKSQVRKNIAEYSSRK
jgi:hypothetical protein